MTTDDRGNETEKIPMIPIPSVPLRLEAPGDAPAETIDSASVETDDSLSDDMVSTQDADKPVDGVQVGSSPLKRVWSALVRRPIRSQLLIALLCAMLGVAIVAQMQQTEENSLAAYREDDLIGILDEVTQRSEGLQRDADSLKATKEELLTSTNKQEAAREAAQRRAQTEGILAGTLPTVGPGISLTIFEGNRNLSAANLYNILEELRNAGAEAVQLNGMRLTASSYIVDTGNGVVADGKNISAPYKWLAIGEGQTMDVALKMPSGALSLVKKKGATYSVEDTKEVRIDAIRSLPDPEFAVPVD